MQFCVLTAGDCAPALALLARYPTEFRTTVQPIANADEAFARFDELTPDPVSYTHLTLPTIYSV